MFDFFKDLAAVLAELFTRFHDVLWEITIQKAATVPGLESGMLTVAYYAVLCIIGAIFLSFVFRLKDIVKALCGGILYFCRTVAERWDKDYWKKTHGYDDVDDIVFVDFGESDIGPNGLVDPMFYIRKVAVGFFATALVFSVRAGIIILSVSFRIISAVWAVLVAVTCSARKFMAYYGQDSSEWMGAFLANMFSGQGRRKRSNNKKHRKIG